VQVAERNQRSSNILAADYLLEVKFYGEQQIKQIKVELLWLKGWASKIYKLQPPLLPSLLFLSRSPLSAHTSEKLQVSPRTPPCLEFKTT